MRRALSSLLAGLLATSALAATGPQSLTPIPERPVAPEFSLVDAGGKTHRLADYRGRPVIVNFWATWCPPCREEMPSMQRGWEQVREAGVAMLAINVGEDEATVAAFTATYAVDFPLLLDPDSAVAQSWPVKGLPTTFVVDPAGRLVYRAIGGRAWDDPGLLDQVRALKR
jgi:peroxiredoxin